MLRLCSSRLTAPMEWSAYIRALFERCFAAYTRCTPLTTSAVLMGARARRCQCAIQREYQTMRPIFGPVRSAHTVFAQPPAGCGCVCVWSLAPPSTVICCTQLKSHSPSGFVAVYVKRALAVYAFLRPSRSLARYVCSHHLLHKPCTQCANYVHAISSCQWIIN